MSEPIYEQLRLQQVSTVLKPNNPTMMVGIDMYGKVWARHCVFDNKEKWKPVSMETNVPLCPSCGWAKGNPKSHCQDEFHKSEPKQPEEKRRVIARMYDFETVCFYLDGEPWQRFVPGDAYVWLAEALADLGELFTVNMGADLSEEQYRKDWIRD